MYFAHPVLLAWGVSAANSSSLFINRIKATALKWVKLGAKPSALAFLTASLWWSASFSCLSVWTYKNEIEFPFTVCLRKGKGYIWKVERNEKPKLLELQGVPVSKRVRLSFFFFYAIRSFVELHSL